MSEAVIRQRLIRLSCAKLLAFKKSSEGLRRSLHVLTVLKHAHSDEARFEPECSDLLRPQPNRLVIILEPAPLQRIPSSSPPSPSPLINVVDRIVPSTENDENDEPIEIDSSNEEEIMMETDDEDGTSMARKRKNHTSTFFLDYNGEKRHCENSFDNSNNSTSTSSGTSSSTTTSKSLDVDNNNNN
jgi:hypothetical protein